jgi:hypothetical protein
MVLPFCCNFDDANSSKDEQLYETHRLGFKLKDCFSAIVEKI